MPVASSVPRCLLVCLLLLAVGPFASTAAQGPDEVGLLEPGRIVQSAAVRLDSQEPVVVDQKVPLLEMYTATWCAPCGPADRAVERLLDEQGGAVAAVPEEGAATETEGTDEETNGTAEGTNGTAEGTNGTAEGTNGTADGNGTDERRPSPTGPAELHVLTYHPWPDVVGDDPFGVPEGNDRMRTKYDATWFPTTVVDGVFVDRPQTRSTDVSEGMEGIFYRSYRALAEDARAHAGPGTLQVETHLEGSNVTVKVRFEASTHVPGPLVLTGALWQDPIPYEAANGVDRLRMTVLDMLPRVTDADGVSEGGTWTVTWSQALPDGADPADHGVTVFIESAWSEPHDADLPALALFTGGVAVATVVTAALLIGQKSAKRTTASERARETLKTRSVEAGPETERGKTGPSEELR